MQHPRLFLATRMANLLVVVGSAYWLGSAKQFGAGITLMLALIGFMVLDVGVHVAVVAVERNRWRDGELFDQLLSTFPPTGGIGLARHLRHLESLSNEAMRDLYDFADAWRDDPSRKFRIAELERLRQELHVAIDTYTSTFAHNVFTPKGGDPDVKRVPREWEREQPERYQRIVGDLDAQAKRVVEAYDRLIDVARRRYSF